MIKEIQDTYPDHKITVYPDASGKNPNSTSVSLSDIALLKDAKFIIRTNPGNPAIKDRVQALNRQVCDVKGVRRLKVNTNNCPVTTEAFEQQPYDENGMPEKKGHDHPMDAEGYLVNQLWPIVHKKFTRTEMR